MWVAGKDVHVGEKIDVRAVGRLQHDGSFWVRRVQNDLQNDEYALFYISDALWVLTCKSLLYVVYTESVPTPTHSQAVLQSCKPLQEYSPGELCVANFSQDGRWYRSVVVAMPKPGIVSVYDTFHCFSIHFHFHETFLLVWGFFLENINAYTTVKINIRELATDTKF